MGNGFLLVALYQPEYACLYSQDTTQVTANTAKLERNAANSPQYHRIGFISQLNQPYLNASCLVGAAWSLRLC